MTMAQLTPGKMRGIGATLMLLGMLTTASDLFAASPQPPDASRRLYDRVMEEFRHKDYPAALAGFRFFLELQGNPPCRPTHNTGWGNANPHGTP